MFKTKPKSDNYTVKMAEDPICQKRLQKFFLELDKEKKVSPKIEFNRSLENDVRKIITQVLDKITEKDPRWTFTIQESGSFFEGLKVGNPDEYDYLAELTSLNKEEVKFTLTDDPGFVQISLSSPKLRQVWKECLSDREKLKQESDWVSVFKVHKYEEHIGKRCDCFKTSSLCPECVENDKLIANYILSPNMLQAQFKTLFDNVIHFDVRLPECWEHGGKQQPHYSGYRRHGPATMIQLVYNQGEKECIVNVDITLAIPMQHAIDLNYFTTQLNMNVFDNTLPGSDMERILKEAMLNESTIHFIPIYSKMLVKTQKYANKYSFRISCSSLEKRILGHWSEDAGPKKCIRILKALRDKYLCDKRIDTNRTKSESRKVNPQYKGYKSIEERVAKEGWDKLDEEFLESMRPRPFSRRALAKAKISSLIQGSLGREETDLVLRGAYQIPDSAAVNHQNTSTVESGSSRKNEWLQEFAYQPNERNDNQEKDAKGVEGYKMVNAEHMKSNLKDATDFTEKEDYTKTKEYALSEYERNRYFDQQKDVSDMEPRSGEYYGPTPYVQSLEIKTYVLKLLSQHWEEEFWTDQAVCVSVERFLDMYKSLLSERKEMRNFFFDTRVCSPIMNEERVKTLKKFEVLEKDLQLIKDGKDINNSQNEQVKKIAKDTKLKKQECELSSFEEEYLQLKRESLELKRKNVEQQQRIADKLEDLIMVLMYQ